MRTYHRTRQTYNSHALFDTDPFSVARGLSGSGPRNARVGRTDGRNPDFGPTGPHVLVFFFARCFFVTDVLYCTVFKIIQRAPLMTPPKRLRLGALDSQLNLGYNLGK